MYSELVRAQEDLSRYKYVPCPALCTAPNFLGVLPLDTSINTFVLTTHTRLDNDTSINTFVLTTHTRLENDSLSNDMRDILSELEAKAPEIQKMKEDYAEVLKVCLFRIRTVDRYRGALGTMHCLFSTTETGHLLAGEI